MATIDLGRIKQVWRGTYAGGTAYVPDDVVSYADGAVTSSYICVANTTGNAPSSGGTLHASWAYMSKGASASPTTTRGDIIYRGASADARLAKGSSGQILTMGADDPGWAAAPESNWVKLAGATLTGQTLSTIRITEFTTTYNYYRMFFSNFCFTGTNMPYMRLQKQSDSGIQSASNYSWVSMHPYVSGSGGNHNQHSSWNNNHWRISADNNVNANFGLHGWCDFYNTMASEPTFISWHTVGEEGNINQLNVHHGGGWYNADEQHKGFEMWPSGNHIASINYSLYGIK